MRHNRPVQHMRRRSVALCAVFLVLALETVHAQQPTDLVNRRFAARVTLVADGDTLDVVIPPSRRVRVRLHGADAPEFGEPFSNRARSFMRGLMFGRDVTITGKDVDAYGRLVARVAVDDADASESLIAAGLGCTYRRYATDAALEAALADALRAKRGFWAAGAAQPACVAREARVRVQSPPRSR
jgi:endonuclease YncB( thermonuclease family)